MAADPSGRSEFTAPANAGRLDLLVASTLGLSRNRAATLIATGCVTVNGRAERASHHPEDADVVVVDVPTVETRAIEGESIPLTIVYEDDDLLVVDKAAGMVVHPAPGHWTGTLVNALKGRGTPLATGATPGREGIVHRLDKETSGLLLVAKSDRAHRVLGAALAARRVVRRYAALSMGHLAEDRVVVDRPIARDPRDRKRMAIVSTGRQAVTEFTRIARLDRAELLRARLQTGRTHQIRVHLASIGHPVAGDDTYGSKAGGMGGARPFGLPEHRHFLHAASLAIRHPATGVDMEWRSPLPPELTRALVAAAGEHAPRDTANLLDSFGFFRFDA